MALIEGNDPFGRPIIDQQASAQAASNMPYADPNYSVPVGGSQMPTAHDIAMSNTVLDPSQAGTGIHTPIGGSAVPGGGGAPQSSHPDYNFLLQNDPNYMATQNDYDAQLKRALATLTLEKQVLKDIAERNF